MIQSDLQHDIELESYNAIRHLQLWLNTVAPLEEEIIDKSNNILIEIIINCGWQKHLAYDMQLEKMILKNYSENKDDEWKTIDTFDGSMFSVMTDGTIDNTQVVKYKGYIPDWARYWKPLHFNLQRKE